MRSNGGVGVRTRDGRAEWADLWVVLVMAGLVCLPVWPGIYTSDSQAILSSARAGQVSNWYAPLLGWVWGEIDGLGMFPGVVFLAGVAGFAAATLALAKQLLPPRAARLVTVVVMLFPPIYGLLGWVGRDVWFATAALAITAAALRIRRTGVASAADIVGLIVVGIVAADTRQNGIPFAGLAFGLVSAGLWWRLARRSTKRVRAAAIAGGILAGLVLVIGLQHLATNIEHYPEQILLGRDLTAVTLDQGRPAMDRFLFPSQDVSALSRQLRGRDPDAFIGLDPPTVRYSPFADQPESAGVNAAFRRQWWTMLTRHPLAYLDTRFDLFLHQTGISRNVRTPYFGSSDIFPGSGLEQDVTSSFPGLRDARNRFLSWTDGMTGEGSVLHAPILYLLAAVGSIWTFGQWWGDRRGATVLIGVLVSMQALLFFTAPTSEYRFQFFQVAIGTTFLLSALLQAGSERARSGHGR